MYQVLLLVLLGTAALAAKAVSVVLHALRREVLPVRDDANVSVFKKGGAR